MMSLEKVMPGTFFGGILDEFGSAPRYSDDSAGRADGQSRTAPADARCLQIFGWAAMVSIGLKLASFGWLVMKRMW